MTFENRKFNSFRTCLNCLSKILAIINYMWVIFKTSKIHNKLVIYLNYVVEQISMKIRSWLLSLKKNILSQLIIDLNSQKNKDKSIAQ